MSLSRLSAIAIAAALLIPAVSASADVLTFDDIATGTGPGVFISSPYHGFNWSNFAALDSTFQGPSGYVNGTVSGSKVAYNSGGGNASFLNASSGLFTLDSAYITGAWNDGLSVVIQGLNNGSVLFTKTVVVNTAGPTFVNFGWGGINSVSFSASGGTNHGYNGSGTHFALDNVSVNGPSAIPEPSEYAFAAFTGVSLIGLVVRARRRSNKASTMQPA